MKIIFLILDFVSPKAKAKLFLQRFMLAVGSQRGRVPIHQYRPTNLSQTLFRERLLIIATFSCYCWKVYLLIELSHECESIMTVFSFL